MWLLRGRMGDGDGRPDATCPCSHPSCLRAPGLRSPWDRAGVEAIRATEGEWTALFLHRRQVRVIVEQLASVPRPQEAPLPRGSRFWSLPCWQTGAFAWCWPPKEALAQGGASRRCQAEGKFKVRTE